MYSDGRYWVEQAEKEGRVADNTDVRLGLIQKVKSGLLTLEQAQKELARIKRNAKKNGKITRNQAFRGF